MTKFCVNKNVNSKTRDESCRGNINITEVKSSKTLDVGTGSGCIILSIIKKDLIAKKAIDISKNAQMLQKLCKNASPE